MGMGTGGNGNSTLGNPTGMGMSQKVGNGTGENGNWVDGNGREWECWKPFPHISSSQTEPCSSSHHERCYDMARRKWKHKGYNLISNSGWGVLRRGLGWKPPAGFSGGALVDRLGDLAEYWHKVCPRFNAVTTFLQSTNVYKHSCSPTAMQLFQCCQTS